MAYRFLVLSHSGSSVVLTSYDAKPFDKNTEKMPVIFQKTLSGISYSATSTYTLTSIFSKYSYPDGYEYNTLSWAFTSGVTYSDYVYFIKESTPSSYKFYSVDLETGSCKLALTLDKSVYGAALLAYVEVKGVASYSAIAVIASTYVGLDPYPISDSNPVVTSYPLQTFIFRALDKFELIDTHISGWPPEVLVNPAVNNGDSEISVVQFAYKGSDEFYEFSQPMGASTYWISNGKGMMAKYTPSLSYSSNPLNSPYDLMDPRYIQPNYQLFTTEHSPFGELYSPYYSGSYSDWLVTPTGKWGNLAMANHISYGSATPWSIFPDPINQPMFTNVFNPIDGGAQPGIAATGFTSNPSFFFMYFDKNENFQVGFFEQTSSSLIDVWATRNATSSFSMQFSPEYIGEGHVIAHYNAYVTSDFQFYPTARSHTVSFGAITHPAFSNVSSAGQINQFGDNLYFWEGIPITLSDIIAESAVTSNKLATLGISPEYSFRWENKKQVEESAKGI